MNYICMNIHVCIYTSKIHEVLHIHIVINTDVAHYISHMDCNMHPSNCIQGVFTITLDPSQMEGALASDDMAHMIAEKAAAQYMQSGQLNTHGRGVGKREKQPSVVADNTEEDDGFLSEDRLLAIALEVSMMEQ